MGLVDAKYKFIQVDVGAYGWNSDGGVFATSNFGRAFNEGQLNIPEPEPLQDAGALGPMPYVIVADEAFPLKGIMMRPFPGGRQRLPLDKAAFNYRLSRARRVVENAFGLLATRWHIYERRMNLSVDNTIKVVLASCVIHNFLQARSTPLPIPVLGAQDAMVDPQPQGWDALERYGYRAGHEAMEVREQYKWYFNDHKVLHYQEHYLQRGLDWYLHQPWLHLDWNLSITTHLYLYFSVFLGP